MRDFGLAIEPTPRWARALESSEEEALVAVALDESDARLIHVVVLLVGLSLGPSPRPSARTAPEARAGTMRVQLPVLDPFTDRGLGHAQDARDLGIAARAHAGPGSGW